MISFMSVFYFFLSPFVMASIESLIFLKLSTLGFMIGSYSSEYFRFDCFCNSSFNLTIYCFCWPLTYRRAFIYCSDRFMFFSVILYVISPSSSTPSALLDPTVECFCKLIIVSDSLGMEMLFFINKDSNCRILLFFNSISSSLSLVI